MPPTTRVSLEAAFLNWRASEVATASLPMLSEPSHDNCMPVPVINIDESRPSDWKGRPAARVSHLRTGVAMMEIHSSLVTAGTGWLVKRPGTGGRSGRRLPGDLSPVAGTWVGNKPRERFVLARRRLPARPTDPFAL
jgi:hypothetical protein